jgi:DNA-binding PadR family transcriptional regulator
MVSARTAVLLALRGGPVYGRELIRRIGRVTGGRVRLSAGTVYPALRALRTARLVAAWSVIPGRKRGGRSRVYYELTVAGVRRAEADANALVEIADAGRRVSGPTQATRDVMRARLLRVGELGGAVARLRASLVRERPGMSPASKRRADLVGAAVRLARLIGPDECVLIGGLAVGVHGFVRATDDLDFITRQPLELTRARLREAGIDARLLRGDVVDGGFPCIKGEIGGVPFDVLPPLVPIAWEDALRIDVAGGTLGVVDLDGLLRLKFRAGGPQDLLDAARLVLRHPDTEERARELATAYRASNRFDTWRKDPRIRAQAREEAALERRRTPAKASRKASVRKRRRAAPRSRRP